MHEPIKQMLNKYQCYSEHDCINAIKEIFQEIALLGLWRAKFFEKAAFYGGSALRILYGLDRFSEDLDFSLLQTHKNFDLAPYNQAVLKELEAFGFEATVDTKIKNASSNIESAFIKADSKKQLLTIAAPGNIIKSLHKMHKIKIKMEVDTNPPGLFSTETKFLLQPIPFAVRSYIEPDLFAGKIHAILCRPWVNRVKGRDWYDFVWHVGRNTPVHLEHLKARLVQSGAITQQNKFKHADLVVLLRKKIVATDFEKAKIDILPFIKDSTAVAIWSEQFFLAILDKMQTIASVN